MQIFGTVTALIVRVSEALSEEAVKPRVTEHVGSYADMLKYTDVWTSENESHPNRICNNESHQDCTCRIMVITVPQTATASIRFCHRYSQEQDPNVLDIIADVQRALPELWERYITAPTCELFLSNCSTPLSTICRSAGVEHDMFVSSYRSLTLLALVPDSDLHTQWLLSRKVPFSVLHRRTQHILLSLNGDPREYSSYTDVQQALKVCTDQLHHGVPVVKSVAAVAYIGCCGKVDEVLYPAKPCLSPSTGAAASMQRLMAGRDLQEVRIRYICVMQWRCLEANRANRCTSCGQMQLHHFFQSGAMDLAEVSAMEAGVPHWVCTHTEPSWQRDAFLVRREQYWRVRADAEHTSMRSEDYRALEQEAMIRVRQAVGNELKATLTTVPQLQRALKQQYGTIFPAWSSRFRSQTARQDAEVAVKRDIRRMMQGTAVQPEVIPLLKRSYRGNLMYNSAVYPQFLRLHQ
jgi:hypothetical protein